MTTRRRQQRGRRREKKFVPSGKAFILSTFNNTIKGMLSAGVALGLSDSKDLERELPLLHKEHPKQLRGRLWTMG